MKIRSNRLAVGDGLHSHLKPGISFRFLGERYKVTFAFCRRKSVRLSVCLSVCLSVTLVDPTQRVELFTNIFAPANRVGTRAVYVTRAQLSQRGCAMIHACQ